MFNFDMNYINLAATVLGELIDTKKLPKSVKIATYTLNDTGINALMELHRHGVEISVVCGNYLAGKHTSELPFRVVQNRKNHAKLFIIDDNIYVGSVNLVADTMTNQLIKVTSKQSKTAVRELFTAIRNSTAEPKTHIV